MLALLATLSIAHAEESEVEYVTELTSPQQLTSDNGNWSRLFPAEDGNWNYFRASGGDYLHWTMDADLNLISSSKKLSGRTDLVDHAIDLCPDGTWLHVASTNTYEGANDGARIFRYDENLDKARNYNLAEGDTEYTYNDAPAMCSEKVDAAGFQAVTGELGRFVAGFCATVPQRQIFIPAPEGLEDWRGKYLLVRRNLFGMPEAPYDLFMANYNFRTS